MATKKKLLQAAAGAAGGAALNVEDVFSTYLYTGNNSTQTITNGIDLDGEGGLMWTKARNNSYDHILFDTERGVGKYLFTNSNAAEGDFGGTFGLYANTSGTGFVINGGGNAYNDGDAPTNYASWTFRKAPKFFTCLTYTGDGTAGRTISHDLGSTPGCIIIKGTSSNYEWPVYHRGMDSTAPEDYYMWLNYTSARTDNVGYWNDTAPTSTQFTLGNNGNVNASGGTYVAYLFAHNDGDGEFGPDADADIIKCGSFTGNGSTDGPEIDLGFEPQWILTKGATQSGNWVISDNMRGTVTGGDDEYLLPNSSGAAALQNNYEFNSTGFKVTTTNLLNTSGETYIYIAIRRGPMAVPTDATEVFYLEEANNPNKFVTTGFVTDLALQKHPALSSSWYLADRLRGENKWLSTNTTGADLVGTDSTYYTGWDYMNGVDMNIYPSQSNDHIFYMCKRAPSFFDVVAWTAGSSANRRLNHNLTVTPEFAISKSRSNAGSWWVYHKDLGSDKYINLNLTSAAATLSGAWPTPTATEFGVRESHYFASGWTIVTYLFASLAGVSKVGSYTGNGSTQTIDCGFSAGARFILIKRTDSTGDWYVWDTARGIVAGNDPHLSLNTTAAEVTTDDSIDPVSSGFAVNQVSATNINVSSATYIFYAVA